MASGERYAKAMSRATSFFLDLLRLLAAGAVFAYHCILFWYPAYVGGMVGDVGHRAVVVFFVLSGYVIAFSTFRKPTRARDYVAARLSRLYSVVLPALVLTAVLQVVGTRFNPAFYASFERGHDVLRYLLASVFLQSVWTTNTSPPTNGPFWSLGYEFWYYSIFGAAVFVRRLRWKLLAVIFLLAVSGIDIWLLMPAWVAGAVLYVWSRKSSIPKGRANVFAMVALVACGAAILWLPNWPGIYGDPPYFFSSAYLTDGLIGLLLMALIGLVDQAFRASGVSAKLDAVVRWLADHTFSLYLYHFPIILFVSAVFPFDRTNPLQVAGVLAVILLSILLLSSLTEATRGRWRDFFAAMWDRVAKRLGQTRPVG